MRLFRNLVVHLILGGGGHKQLNKNNRRQQLLLFAIALVILSIVALSYFCPENLCRQTSSSTSSSENAKSNSYYSLPWISSLLPYSFSDSSVFNSNNNNNSPSSVANSNSEAEDVDRVLERTFGFDFGRYEGFRLAKTRQVNFEAMLASPTENAFHIRGNDVMVFLHMQKTGGSAFDRHLVRDLILDQPCKCEPKRKKKCRCFRPNTANKYWLFSRYSIGWKCGLHADYTELVNCVDRVLNQVEHVSSHPQSFRERQQSSSNLVPANFRSKRRYFYVTLLRDPIARFISEFKHVQRGATWKTSRHWCDGRLPTQHELPRCFRGQNWLNVSLSEFISCPDNLAFNRQTRMLADLSLVGCYNQSVMSSEERDLVMLYSAKRNLRQMAFFGLCEEQIASQYLFERTFEDKFKRAFVQFNSTRSRATLRALPPDMVVRIRALNHLDMKLYAYARELFRERFVSVKNRDENFENNFELLMQQSLTQPKHPQVSLSGNKTRRTESTESVLKQPQLQHPKGKPTSTSPDEDDYDTGDDQSNDVIYDEAGGQHGSEAAQDSVEDYYSNKLDEDDNAEAAEDVKKKKI